MEEMKEVAQILKVLSNENRLMIVCYLIQSPMTVSQLHEKLGNMTQSALSQHLSILKAHKILQSEKQGQNITYDIYDSRIKTVIEVLKKNYCYF
ncbi:MAG TPA: transcriptional regulator [Eubacteriaceae bacterium]|jgi:DNA-binding transcriptional ArsR family regulator|nr:transcriptional regulator [Eubacteriaceae bacterium]